MKKCTFIIWVFSILILLSCHNESPKKTITPIVKPTQVKEESTIKLITIDIVPFYGTSNEIRQNLFERLKLICPSVSLLESIPFPTNAYYEPRNRYKADSLISFLASRTQEEHVTIGITNWDISTATQDSEDFGIFGLGFCPGNACVVSSYRLNKNNLSDQIFKVSIHELGHTQGLFHCADTNCFMRDAKGRNTTDQEKEFCPKCKAILISKGWKIN